MSLYVLDTDHVSLAQREHPAVLHRLATKAAREVAITIVTAEEQLRGWLNAIRKASASQDRLLWAYAGLRSALDYIQSAHLLDFDQKALARFDDLRRQRLRVGTRDLRIAAVTLAAGGILVTRNARDFSRIPGLVVEDWS